MGKGYRQEETGEEQTRQEETRPEGTRQEETRGDKPREDTARGEKTRGDMTRGGKTREDKKEKMARGHTRRQGRRCPGSTILLNAFSQTEKRSFRDS